MKETLRNLLGDLEADKGFMSCVTHWEKIPPREGSYEELPAGLPESLREALHSRGIDRLYSHQKESYRAARAGRSFVVVTPTASGKSLCYNLPVLHSLLKKKEARALYLFPTKALSQDQQSDINESILSGGLPVKVSTYDGDTPASVRMSARQDGRIIITNPDMLHAGILPNHPKWVKFLKNLHYVIIDEIHTYRGIFGSHMTNLLRRLKRIAAFYGSYPVFICCSATIGNPGELASMVLEQDVQLIDNNGAPSGERHLILYNPPLVDRVQGIRRGVVLESRKIALRLLKAGIKTIVFARSRVRTELISSYIKKSLRNVYTENDRIRIESYRGGYLPNERRMIERGLREGSIQGVVSTNALELGIDIGGLDAAVLAGFPGSISSSWQQAGRAGRRSDLSLAVLVASSAPLDQYMVGEPGYFFSRSPESGFVDPNNVYILMDHIKCALFELPFGPEFDFAPQCEDYLRVLEEGGVARYTGGRYYWSDRSYPAEEVSLRSAASDNIVIVNTTGGKHEVIGEMDRPSAKELIFKNAVYMHRSSQYVVGELDLENRRCYVEETEVNYYTDSIVKTDIKVLHENGRKETSVSNTANCDILVRSQVAKFKKIRFDTHENVGYGEIALPEEEMHTRALAVLFPPESSAGKALAPIPEELKAGTMARAGTVLKNVSPVFLLCDPRDMGISERLRDPHFGCPALYIYDRYPGGSGISEMFEEKIIEIISAAGKAVSNCPCESGCPSCIGPVDGREETGGENPKAAVSSLFTAWLHS